MMMDSGLWALASLTQGAFWHFFPLVIAVSLVYGATHQEDLPLILENALRFGRWIVGFLAIVFAVLLLMSWWL